MSIRLGAERVREQQESLLDLLNSTPVVDGVTVDRLEDADTAAAWQRAHGGTGTAAERSHLLRVRDALQAVTWGEESWDSLAPLLDGSSLHPRIEDSSRLVWELDAPAPKRLAAQCIMAWSDLQEAMPGRLRACANAHCRLFFIDRSKPNTARWCSMAKCGNRMKAQRHYERKRRTTHEAAEASE